MTTAIEIGQEELQINQDTMQGMSLTFDLAGEGYGLEIQGLGKIGGKVKILLNIEALVEEDDLFETITEKEVVQ